MTLEIQSDNLCLGTLIRRIYDSESFHSGVSHELAKTPLLGMVSALLAAARDRGSGLSGAWAGACGTGGRAEAASWGEGQMSCK